MKNSICDIEGIKVGQITNVEALTGCTVILFEKDAIGGVSIRGSASGTRELDCLSPYHLVDKLHSILLTGGSAFGLDAAGGVMKYLEERKIGFFVGKTYVPIVPTAVIFDLGVGLHNVRPDVKMGYSACEVANTFVEQGSVGAGTGATVGKLFGIEYATKGGVGTASIELSGGVIVGALCVVNAFGDVYDKEKIIAGAISPQTGNFANTVLQMKLGKGRPDFVRTSTTLCVVATNAKLTKVECNKVASCAHNGIAKVIRPSHTMFDGDTIFAVSCGDKIRDVNTIAYYSQEVVSQAIINAIKFARPLGGIKSFIFNE